MARQKGLLKIDGTIGGMTFHRTKDGLIVKEQIPSTKNKFKSDPAFERTRENAREFGMAATSGKMIRNAIRSFMSSSADSRVTSRLTQAMSYILKEDTTSRRGDRTVANGIQTINGKAFLRNFNFNVEAILGTVVTKHIQIDTATGAMTIPNLKPSKEISYPQGATHITFKNAFMSIDFNTGQTFVEYSPEVDLPINGVIADVTLEPDEAPTLNPGMTSIYFLAVEFSQEVNGQLYALNNGEFNCMEIIEVV